MLCIINFGILLKMKKKGIRTVFFDVIAAFLIIHNNYNLLQVHSQINCTNCEKEKNLLTW